jgi:hypothetical protein
MYELLLSLLGIVNAAEPSSLHGVEPPPPR